MPDPVIQVAADPKALAEAAAQRIFAAAHSAADRRQMFSIALSGGNTPKALFQLLAAPPMRDSIDWKRWEIYWGDERCVPPDHPDSNYRMAKEELLDHVPIDPDKIHRMKGELDPNQAAKEYGELLKEKFGDGGLELILLGMGDDGHTASLFPGTAALNETKHRCVANFVPKMKTWRITLTAPFINKSRQVMIVVEGKAKAPRIDEVLHGPRDPQNLPIQLIQPTDGRLIWMLDVPAAGMDVAE
jgi:6-phosphogluconolactonase